MNANVSIYQDSVKDSSGILTSESNEMGLSTIFNYNGNNVAFIKTSYGILPVMVFLLMPLIWLAHIIRDLSTI